MNIKDFDCNKYEYRKPKELDIDKANYIMLPMSVALDTELDKCRMALLAYIAMYKGLNGRMLFSIPKFVEWAGFKSDSRTGCINEKVLDVLNELSHLGYIIFYGDNPTKTSVFELIIDRRFLSEMCGNNFCILWVDEIERIMKYERSNLKDTHLNSFSVFLVFTYLRRNIFRRSNELQPEECYPEKIKSRKERLPEAYAITYKEIGEKLGLSQNTVTKAVKILEQLKLIVVEEAYRIKMEDGEYRTPYTMFANYEKREDKYLLDSGIEYAHREMELKVKQIEKYSPYYKLKYEKITA